MFVISAVGPAAGAWNNTDRFRHGVERIDPVSYLADGYYGRWLGGIETLLVEAGALSTMTGGTFTISNGGVFGSLLSTPILNPPQNAILGMHKIQERPVAVDGEVVIRPMMYLALSYDHRLIDGQEAVRFLVAIKNFLEQPARILLDL